MAAPRRRRRAPRLPTLPSRGRGPQLSRPPRIALDGDESGPSGAEVGGDLRRLDPGTGAEVEHPLPRPRRQRLDDGAGPAGLRHEDAVVDRGFDPPPVAALDDQRGRRSRRACWVGGTGLDPIGDESLEDSSRLTAEAVNPEGALRRLVYGREQPSRAVGAELFPPEMGEPRRHRVGDRRRVGIVVAERREQGRPLTGGSAKHRVDEPRAAPAARRALGEGDRLIDGGVVGVTAREEQLEDAEPQSREERRVDLRDGPPGKLGDEVISGAPPLHRAVGEGLRLRALAAGQALARRGAAQCPVGPGLLLEHPAQRLVGGQPRRRRRAQAGAAGPGTP